ncbi:glycosyltransferase [Vibrio alginolyticus]|uniref:glycosyltransferase n=1 Tax=Vibrio alginolyticus TaxID=663 RepID=UPI001BD6C3A3|nr:glycosyltransferase [Vibrio alginolyticus]
MVNKIPVISIITICYNNPSDLKITLKSVLNSSSVQEDYEIVVIDGSDNDSCQLVLNQFKQLPIISVHEPDNGIYNAMNKGLKYVRGASVLFLNSGDSLHESFDLNTFIDRFKMDLGNKIIFGDVQHCVGSATIIKSMSKVIHDEFWWTKTLPSHQSVFIPLEFYNSNNFDESFKISADTKLMRCAFSKLTFVYFPSVISNFCLGGVSSNPGSVKKINTHMGELIKTKRIGKVSSCLLYISLLRRLLLIRLLGLERYYKIVFFAKRVLGKLC